MPQTSLTFNCNHANRCSGCGWFQKSYSEQRALKVEGFAKSWIAHGLPAFDFEPNFVSVAEAGLRDRVDLVIDNRTGEQRIGLFDHEHKEIVDLVNCPQLTPMLHDWLDEFRQLKWPIQRGSIRLRVSPQNERGVWLDFANEDVKNLFEEESLLKELLTKSFVEIGQRRKRLIHTGEKLKLIDPELQPWFETYIEPKFKPVPLLCNVGGFTQPGFKSNRVLIAEVLRVCNSVQAENVAEFGSGIGNFTLPLASHFKKVDAFEIDRLACDALAANLVNVGLDSKVTIHQGDFQVINERRNFDAEKFELVVVDPPRSGLRQFLDPLVTALTRPANFIYVSCYPDSFCKDSIILYELGYCLKSATIVDQFPQTSHSELVAHFSLPMNF